MLRVLLASLSMLSLTVNGLPSSPVQPLNDQGLNDSNVLTFEQLARAGWNRMRQPFPLLSLKMVSGLPLRQGVAALDAHAFRHVILIAQDRRTAGWIWLSNIQGRNTWETVQQIRNVPAQVQQLPPFTLEPYAFSLKTALERVRAAGFAQPFHEIRISRGEFPEAQDDVAYVFRDISDENNVLVCAWNGEVHRVGPTVDPHINEGMFDTVETS